MARFSVAGEFGGKEWLAGAGRGEGGIVVGTSEEDCETPSEGEGWEVGVFEEINGVADVVDVSYEQP